MKMTPTGDLTFAPFFNTGQAEFAYGFFNALFDYGGNNPYIPNHNWPIHLKRQTNH